MPAEESNEEAGYTDGSLHSEEDSENPKTTIDIEQSSRESANVMKDLQMTTKAFHKLKTWGIANEKEAWR